MSEIEEKYNHFFLADQYLRKKYGEDYEKLRIVIDYLIDEAREGNREKKLLG